MAGVPTDRTITFQKAAATSFQGDEADRIVNLLRSWDTNGDGMFSVQEVLSAAREMMTEKKQNKRLLWVMGGIVVLYVVTIGLLLGVTVAAVELAKDAKPDANGIQLTTGTKDAVRVKSKTDVTSPFDFATTSLEDIEKLDGLYIDDLLMSNGDVLERYYTIQMVTKNKKAGSVKVDFFGGDYLDIDSEKALLFRPAATSGCGEKGIEVNGYCAVAEILNGEDPRDAERRLEATTENSQPNPSLRSAEARELQGRVAIVGPAYGTGPRGIGPNVNFNTGRVYDSDGIVSLSRSRFFRQGQFRACRGPSCAF